MNTYYQTGLRAMRNSVEKCPNRCDDDIDDIRRDCRPNKIIFRCNNLTGASGIPIVAIGDLLTPRNIGSVAVQDLHCLRRPCIKIDISAIVTFTAAIAVGTTVTFRLFRRCNMGTEIEVQSFDFVQGLTLLAGSSIPVHFSYCDCDGGIGADNCVYRATVEASADLAVLSAINVNQGTISVLAGDMC